jgi:ATP-dependent helicase/nuclease subunit A
VIRPRKAELMEPYSGIIATTKAREQEEHWRLLYVALTRAAERLVVAGVLPKRGLSENCWYEKVRLSMEALGAAWRDDPRWQGVLEYRGSVPASAVRPRARGAKVPLPQPLIPDWATRAAPPEARPPRPLAPSALVADAEAAPPPSESLRAAARRGILIHQLFERLPGVQPGERTAAALRWLERSAGVADAAEREQIAGLVCSILDDPQFKPLFGPGSLAEAPIAATLPDGRVVAGTVDRLLIETDEVSVVDFKTGRVPSGESEIPGAHRAQMSAYAEALRVIFPSRRVSAALLYTGAPRLFQLTA